MVTNNPTTTGGKLMPVFTKLTTNRRPGNSLRASNTPKGMPRRRLISVAERETCNERKVIRQTSGSPERSSQKACLMPMRRRSIVKKHLGLRSPSQNHLSAKREKSAHGLYGVFGEET